MSVNAQCPICRQKQSLKNKRCRCGEDLDKAKKASRVKYWIASRVPAKSDQGKKKIVQRWQYVGYSLKEAKDADGKRRVQKRENRIFEILPTGNVTFQELAAWHLDQDTVKAKRYYPSLKFYLVNFLKEFGGRMVDTIMTVELQNYQTRRKAAGLSDSYVDHEIGTAKAVIYMAHDNKKVDSGTVLTFKKVKKLLKKGSNARKKILSLAQFLKLMKYLPQHTKQVLVIAFYTGVRKGEILNLLWPQVKMKKRVIELEPKDTKNKKPRIVPFGHMVHATLKEIPKALNDKHVILYRGKPVNDIRAGLKEACKLAGIPYGQRVKGGFVFHDVRHSFNTHMRKAGVARSVTKDIVGHETEDMQDRYDTVDDDDRKAAVRKHESFIEKELLKISKAVRKKKVDHSVDHKGKEGTV